MNQANTIPQNNTFIHVHVLHYIHINVHVNHVYRNNSCICIDVLYCMCMCRGKYINLTTASKSILPNCARLSGLSSMSPGCWREGERGRGKERGGEMGRERRAERERERERRERGREVINEDHTHTQDNCYKCRHNCLCH